MNQQEYQEIGARLAKICQHCPHVTDEAIDLHNGVRKNCSPGTCAKAFFRLAVEAGKDLPQEISALGSNVSNILAVEATRPDGEFLEKIDFAPEKSEDLESFCQRMINLFWNDRGYAPKPLKLQFCFR